METSPINSLSNLSEENHSYNRGYGSRQDDEVDLLRSKYKQSNNKVYHDFYKTKVCSLYNLNICKKGAECPFAHNDDELRDKPNLYRTKLCDAFLQGRCEKGDQCTFAHGEEDLRSTPDLFKTAICNLWTQGKCTAGETCRFAHGYDDLRPAPSHHKFNKKSHNKGQFNQHNGKSNYNHKGHHQGYSQHDQGMYYQNQYAYAPHVYSYPMYTMPMMPGDMQHPYMMQQQYGGYHHGMGGPSMRPN